MFAFLSLLFCFVSSATGKETVSPLAIGGSFSTYDSRFFSDTKDTVWLRTEFCTSKGGSSEKEEKIPCVPSKLFLEKRNERPLASGSVETNRMYLSYGNRFKPSRHFFFLRENFEFSSFPYLEQPTIRSAFLGGFLGQSMGSLYYAEKGASKRPGFFLKPFGETSEFAYSPETKEGFILLEIPNSFRKKSPESSFGFRLEAFGTKQDPNGILSAYWQDPVRARRFFISGYQGISSRLFTLSSPSDPGEKGKFLRLVWEPGYYRKLEAVQLERSASDPVGSDKRIAKGIFGKLGLFITAWGAVSAQIRTYRFYDRTDWTVGKGLYYGFQKRLWSWEIGQEWRENGDKLTEATARLHFPEHWKLQLSVLAAKEKNREPAFVEESLTPEETGLRLTDKPVYIFARIYHPYFALTLRHTRGLDSKGDSLSARFQFFLPLSEDSVDSVQENRISPALP
ncbi:hypothetical protein EHO60_15260 [Leptospira fletcheri]|uniref:Porin n=1 Tax=Leptospira fletcheri TaxID=2484981 RepID=A0A4R9G4U7_9LEPT|nr:hypothetical protein EHO60_15260 [Leptospira fletcheri]